MPALPGRIPTSALRGRAEGNAGIWRMSWAWRSFEQRLGNFG
jgi:hypothetical protein